MSDDEESTCNGKNTGNEKNTGTYKDALNDRRRQVKKEQDGLTDTNDPGMKKRAPRARDAEILYDASLDSKASDHPDGKPKPRLFVSRLPSFDPSGEFLYGTYRLLFHCDAPLHNKQKAFEASALCDTSWFVESISLAAAERLLEKGNASGVRRAHAMSRSERAKAMFVRTDLMPKDEMLEFFLRHDSTTVVTTEENNQPGDSHWSPLIPVPAGHFTSPSFKIRLRKTVELSWLHQELASRR